MERDEFLRAAWKVMVAEEVEAKQLVFVDEMGANTSLPAQPGRPVEEEFESDEVIERPPRREESIRRIEGQQVPDQLGEPGGQV